MRSFDLKILQVIEESGINGIKVIDIIDKLEGKGVFYLLSTYSAIRRLRRSRLVGSKKRDGILYYFRDG